MTFDALKRRSRGLLHRTMARPVYYFADAAQAPDIWQCASARLHGKRGQIGDLPGTNLNYAEIIDRAEKVVFLVAELPNPVRGALVVFSPSEGYWLDAVDPVDGVTVSASVVRATATELSGLSAPS